MGKKTKRTTKTSKGLHSAISKSTIDAVRADRAEVDKFQNKLAAWKKGKNPWITIDNIGGPPDRLFRRVKANSLWGDPRKIKYNIYLNNNKKAKNAPSL